MSDIKAAEQSFPEPESPSQREFVAKEDLIETFEEYRSFAFQGDMIKMATAFIMGAAFDGVVKSISGNLIMPVLNFVVLKASGNWKETVFSPIPGLTFEIGKALGSFVDFLLISLVLFFLIKWMGKLEIKKRRKRRKKRKTPSNRYRGTMQIKSLKLALTMVDNCPKCGKETIVTLVGFPEDFNDHCEFFCIDHGKWDQRIGIEDKIANLRHVPP